MLNVLVAYVRGCHMTPPGLLAVVSESPDVGHMGPPPISIWLLCIKWLGVMMVMGGVSWNDGQMTGAFV